MFRSLFIGFLILSALTTKGAEVQINQNIANIPADMLLEIFNAAVAHADKQVELSAAGSERMFFSNPDRSRAAIEELLRVPGQNSPAVWDTPYDRLDVCSNLWCDKVALRQKQFSEGEVYAYGADLSPPSL